MLSNPNQLPSRYILTFGDGPFCWFLRDWIDEECMSCQEVSLSYHPSSFHREERREFSNIVITRELEVIRRDDKMICIVADWEGPMY